MEPRATHPGRSLLATAALLLAAGLGAQLAGFRAPILTGSDRSMTQYEALRAHVEREGPNDLVVLGNSVARQGIQPALLRRWLGRGDGSALRSFNFASGGTATPHLAFMTELLFGIDRPPYCLVVITPPMLAAWRDSAVERGRMLAASPYGQAIGDGLRWRGALQRWLLDHVALFGLRFGLKRTLLLESDPVPDRPVGG